MGHRSRDDGALMGNRLRSGLAPLAGFEAPCTTPSLSSQSRRGACEHGSAASICRSSNHSQRKGARYALPAGSCWTRNIRSTQQIDPRSGRFTQSPALTYGPATTGSRLQAEHPDAGDDYRLCFMSPWADGPQVLALAGIGAVIGTTGVHAANSPATAQVTAESVEAPGSTAADTDTIQSQGGDQVQSGGQQDVAGADAAEAGASTTPDTDTTQSQSQLDTP